MATNFHSTALQIHEEMEKRYRACGAPSRAGGEGAGGRSEGGGGGALQQSKSFKLKSRLIATARVPIVTLSTEGFSTSCTGQAGGRDGGGGSKEYSGGAREQGGEGKTQTQTQTQTHGGVGEEQGGELEADVSANRSGGLHHCLLLR